MKHSNLNFWRIGTGSEKSYIVVTETHPVSGQKVFNEKAFAKIEEANEYIETEYKKLNAQGIFFRIWLDIIKTITQRYQLRGCEEDDN